MPWHRGLEERPETTATSISAEKEGWRLFLSFRSLTVGWECLPQMIFAV